jgi:hypothetical protein
MLNIPTAIGDLDRWSDAARTLNEDGTKPWRRVTFGAETGRDSCAEQSDAATSRQSDSNRRPADYKSAALNQLSYAGAFTT